MARIDIVNLTLDLLEIYKDLPLEFQLKKLEEVEAHWTIQLRQSDLVPRIRREFANRRLAAQGAQNTIPSLRKVIGKSGNN